MSWTATETTQSFQFPQDEVFDGLVSILGPSGYKLEEQDRVIGRILTSTGMSGFSWGENITLLVRRTGDRATDLIVQSNLKVPFNLGGRRTNRRNAGRIIGALSHFLEHGSRDSSASAAAAPSAGTSLIPVAVVVGIMVLLVIVSSLFS